MSTVSFFSYKALSQEQYEIITDAKRLRELSLQSISKYGVTLDESIERRVLEEKYQAIDLMLTLVGIIEDVTAPYLDGAQTLP